MDLDLEPYDGPSECRTVREFINDWNDDEPTDCKAAISNLADDNFC